MIKGRENEFDFFSVESVAGNLCIVFSAPAKPYPMPYETIISNGVVRTIRKESVFDESSLVDRIKNLEQAGHDASLSRSALVSLCAHKAALEPQ